MMQMMMRDHLFPIIISMRSSFRTSKKKRGEQGPLLQGMGRMKSFVADDMSFDT